MASSSRSTEQLLADAQQLLTAIQAERSRFDERYQNLVAQFYRAQATHQRTELAYEQVMQQCALLRERLGLQQETIELLLSYYPQPQRDKLRLLLAA